MGSPKIIIGKKRKRGRPHGLTERIKKLILEKVRSGSYPGVAAVASGISLRTWQRWCVKSEIGEPVFMSFMSRIEKRQAESENIDLEIIGRAARGSPRVYKVDEKGQLLFSKEGKPVVLQEEKAPVWQASAWRLERRYPERYGKRVESTIKGAGPRGEIVVRHSGAVDLSKIPTKDLRILREIAVRTQAIKTEDGEIIH